MPSGDDYIRASSYVNKKGDHPKTPAIMGWNNLVFKEEELNDNNWLYVGDCSEESRRNKQIFLNWHKGFMWILEG